MRKAFAVGTVLAVGGLGWAVAQEPPTIKLDGPVALAPAPLPPAKPPRTLSREAAAELLRLREQARKLTAAAAAFEAEKPKWVGRREVQAVAVRAELAAVTAAEAELASADPPTILVPLPPGGSPAQPPIDLNARRLADAARAKLAATTAARDRQQKLLDQIAQRLAHLDAGVAACEKQKADLRDRMARIYFNELDEDGKGFDGVARPLPPAIETAPPTGEAWADHTRPWPPAADKRP